MLTAGALGAIRVDADVVVLDLHIDLVTHLGHHVDTGERSLSASVRIEGADPDQPVRAPFGLERPVGSIAGDRERGRLDARFVTLGPVVDRDW